MRWGFSEDSLLPSPRFSRFRIAANALTSNVLRTKIESSVSALSSLVNLVLDSLTPADRA